MSEWTLKRMEARWKDQVVPQPAPLMNPKVKSVWVKALRGEVGREGKPYKRCTGQLASPNGRHCCLGVLYDLGESSHNRDSWHDASWLSLSVSKKSMVTEGVQRFLARCNDDGASFAVVADWVEKHL